MSETPTEILDALMKHESLNGLSVTEQLNKIGLLIDTADDTSSEEGTTRALQWCDELELKELTETEKTEIEYFRANAWSNRQRLQHADLDTAWDWSQPELQQQIFHLRKAERSPGFGDSPDLRRCQIETNLANQLDTVGRFVEALAVWDRALGITPRFGMAHGNKASGLIGYANCLYDPGHRGVYLLKAHEHLEAALSSNAEYVQSNHKQIRAFYASKLKYVAKAIDVPAAKKDINLDGHSLGKSKAEQEYRRWALSARLFLNPLNDLGPYSIAANDVLSLPTFTLKIGETPWPIGFFNQMKQEFVSGRWLLYEGLNSHRVHFSDRDVTIHNTLDYTSHALAVEKVKVAFRIGYSLLDKIAFFLNQYAELGVEIDRVYFKSIWYDRKTRKVRPELSSSSNWPLRGLYWLSKDLFDSQFQDVMEPEAQALYAIRNRLEHSYFKVHEMLMPSTTGTPLDMWTDKLAYSVQRERFQEKALHVFRLARAGLTYLSLGMHDEERRRAAGKSETKQMPMDLGLIRDDWKQ